MIATLLLVAVVLQAPAGDRAGLQQTLTDIHALISSGQSAQALEKLQSLPQDDARVKYLKGVAFYHLDDPAKAIDALAPVADQLPDGSVERKEAVQVLARWNPFAKGREREAVKPFVAVGLGPVIGSSVGTFSGHGARATGVNDQATVGGHVGAGVDFHLARWFSVGVTGGYNWMADFSTPVGAHSNYSGAELGMTFGWLFGKGHTHE